MVIILTMIRAAVRLVKFIGGRKFRKRLIFNTLTRRIKLYKDFNSQIIRATF